MPAPPLEAELANRRRRQVYIASPAAFCEKKMKNVYICDEQVFAILRITAYEPRTYSRSFFFARIELRGSAANAGKGAGSDDCGLARSGHYCKIAGLSYRASRLFGTTLVFQPGYRPWPWMKTGAPALLAAPPWPLKIPWAANATRPLRFGPRKIDIDLPLLAMKKFRTPTALSPSANAGTSFCALPLLDIAPQINIGDARLPDWLAALPLQKSRGKKSGNENICRDPFSFGSG